jgi:uncharacterized membrane protein (DUF2068 family)
VKQHLQTSGLTIILVTVDLVVYAVVAFFAVEGSFESAQAGRYFDTVSLPFEVWYLVAAFEVLSFVLVSVLTVRVARGQMQMGRFVLLILGSIVTFVLATYLAWITTYGAIL